jgi:hypothetical protein
MISSGIFLEYHGLVDYQVVDSLLMKLKGTKEFTELHTTLRKRTYSLFVECIENICKHSALKSSDDKNLQPSISVTKEENKIVILAINPVPEESREKLIRRLDIVNNLNVEELRKMHEVRINTEPDKGSNGAGLGFICMAFKTGNELDYSFQPLIHGYLSFKIQITLNTML